MDSQIILRGFDVIILAIVMFEPNIREKER